MMGVRLGLLFGVGVAFVAGLLLVLVLLVLMLVAFG